MSPSSTLKIGQSRISCAALSRAFVNDGPRLACVQARLTIDNSADSWLTRLFTAEYCGLFDVLLPALAHWRLPLPLGGTSNHFRIDVLREVGAWDPYNVTEDADLGMRLARHGYEATVIASSTYEEALSEPRPWINQRSRWFKGWLQTWFVHMRSPIKLFRDMGFRGFVTFQLDRRRHCVCRRSCIRWCWRIILYNAITGNLFAWDGSLVGISNDGGLRDDICQRIRGVSGARIAGLARRNLLAHASAQIMTPVLWILLSISAWRAVVGLIYAPYRWDKTEHGLARTSRQRWKMRVRTRAN